MAHKYQKKSNSIASSGGNSPMPSGDKSNLIFSPHIKLQVTVSAQSMTNIVFSFLFILQTGSAKQNQALPRAQEKGQKIAQLKKCSDCSNNTEVIKTWKNEKSLKGFVISYLVFLRESEKLLQKYKKCNSSTNPFREFFMLR